MALHHCQKWPDPASQTLLAQPRAQCSHCWPCLLLAMPSAPGSCRLMDRQRIKIWENALPPLLGACSLLEADRWQSRRAEGEAIRKPQGRRLGCSDVIIVLLFISGV